MSKTWRKRLKTLWRRQIPLEVSVAKALVGAGESDSDSSGDESDPDEEDDSGAAPGFAPTADAAEEDLLLMMLAQIFLMLVLSQLPSLRLQTHPPQRLHQHLHLPCLHAWLTCSSLEP